MMSDGEHIDSIGTIRWYKNGRLHREDGPAVVWEDGEQQWFRNDALHRLDGPAVIKPDGTKYWYIDGRRFIDIHSFAYCAWWTDKQLAEYLLSN